MRRPVIIVLVAALGACSPTDVPLVGPCAISKRVGPDDTYSGLALSLTIRTAGSFDGTLSLKDEDDRQRRLSRYEDLRATWLPTITDECLRAHADDWIGVSERRIRAYSFHKGGDDFSQREADKKDQQRALAEKLGVRP